MIIYSLKKYSEILLKIILVVICLYTAGKTFKSHLNKIKYPYQLEFREGAVLAETEHYTNGENPYDLKYQPQHTYDYGFIYPLSVSFFSRFVSGNSLALHRWVTYGCILLTCLIVFAVLIRMKVNFIFSLTAAVLLHQSLVYQGLTSIARPEGLGIMFFVAGIVIPWRFNFSLISCALSIIAGLLAYFTKPYYAFVLPVIFIYLMIFVSKKKALLYGIVAAIVFLFTVILVNSVYPTFFNNTFFVHKNYSDYNFKYMLLQFLFYAKYNIFIFVITILSAAFAFYKFRKSGNKFSSSKNQFPVNAYSNTDDVINFPASRTNPDGLFALTLLTSLAAFIFLLGGNTGSDNGAYLFHLSSPFLLLTTFWLLKRADNSLLNIVASILLILALIMQFKPRSVNYESLINVNKKTEELIMSNDNILNSAETTSMIIAHNKKLYNSGHTEYFQTGVSDLSILLGMSAGVMNRSMEYKTEINENIIAKKFDLILVSQTITSFAQFIDRTVLSQHYQCTDTLAGPLSRIEVWIPVR